MKRRHTDAQLAALRETARMWEAACAEVLATGRPLRIAGGVLKRVTQKPRRGVSPTGEVWVRPETTVVVWRRNAAKSPKQARPERFDTQTVAEAL
jgi:hypothetical protein